MVGEVGLEPTSEDCGFNYRLHSGFQHYPVESGHHLLTSTSAIPSRLPKNGGRRGDRTHLVVHVEHVPSTRRLDAHENGVHAGSRTLIARFVIWSPIHWTTRTEMVVMEGHDPSILVRGHRV